MLAGADVWNQRTSPRILYPERKPVMSEVKYFINRREPEAQDLADQMRQAGIDFSSLPTSGPLTLRINGRPSYGPTAVKHAIQKLVEISNTQSQAGRL